MTSMVRQWLGLKWCLCLMHKNLLCKLCKDKKSTNTPSIRKHLRTSRWIATTLTSFDIVNKKHVLFLVELSNHFKITFTSSIFTQNRIKITIVTRNRMNILVIINNQRYVHDNWCNEVSNTVKRNSIKNATTVYMWELDTSTARLQAICLNVCSYERHQASRSKQQRQPTSLHTTGVQRLKWRSLC